MRKTFATSLLILCSLAANALPLVWRADWPGSKPIETLVHRGTDIELEPQWYINGEQAASTNWTFQTFVQTNNQATGEWFGPLPGAAFSHTNDIGSAFYNVMVRAQMPDGGVNYTAFARLRMLDSPGYTPGALPLPVSTIDFSQVVALNAPWLLPDATNALWQTVSINSAAIVSNAADIATLKATSATKADATLAERGFTAWTLSEYTAPEAGGPIVIRAEGSAWYPCCLRVCGDIKPIDSSTTSVTWTADEWEGDYPITAERENASSAWVIVTPQALQDGYEIDPGYVTSIMLVLPEGYGYEKGNAQSTSLTWRGADSGDPEWGGTTDLVATRTALQGYILGAQTNKALAAQSTMAALSDNLATHYYTKAQTDDAIDALAAYYITATAQGAAFATYAALTNATVYYSAGAVRVPTRNDYCVVLADETHGGAEWRYIYAVADGATSGQWEAQYPIETNDYEGLSNKPQINSNELTGNKTGKDLGVLDLAGGTMEGDLSLDYYNLRFGEALDAYATTGNNNDEVVFFCPATGKQLLLKIGNGGTIAHVEDFSASNATFSNAVLSVGIGIDTNTVAVINELVDASHDLPVTGATSVGALLLALAAAIAALKKNLRYSYNTASVTYSTTTDTDDTAAVTNVADRAINTATLGSSVTAATVTLPAATADRARDFFIDLTIEATDAPTLTFIDPATSTTANVAFGADSIADIDTGKNAVLFTEFPNHTWLVSVKHEEAAS